MSTPRENAFLEGSSNDPREVLLVQGLLEKTREGKISWVKAADAITARIPNGFQINFVLSPTSIISSHSSTWQLLTVRDRAGSELLRVNNSAINFITGVAKGAALMQLVNDLFRLVNSGDDLERAIQTINKL
jgi:hypothetical protein